MTNENNISIIGSGNVAYHLAHAFVNAGVKIEYIISRNKQEGARLAEQSGALFSSSFDITLCSSALVLIAVSDNAIEKLQLNRIKNATVIAHTSGSMPLSVLSGISNHGVLYPFQTFSKEVNTGKLTFPICVEGNNTATQNLLQTFAEKISAKVVIMNSEKRKNLHLSGVLANNFSNHIISRAYDFLEDKNIDKDLLLPILEETISKLKNEHPKKLQTGPAMRGDDEIIKKHLALLSSHPSLYKIYEVLSNSISKYYE